METKTEQPTLQIHELDQRKADALTVTLYWVHGTIDTYVTVHDARDDSTATIQTPPGIPPQRVYQHPFTYQDPTNAWSNLK